MKNVILEVKNLTKNFSSRGQPALGGGDFTAVDNLSFSIADGEILGLLGPDGAGKTTTIQMLLGVMKPTAGDIIYYNKSFKKHREEILKDINFSSGYISLPWLLTVEEILDVFARLYEVPGKKKRIRKLLEIFEIEDLLKKQFCQLSAGQSTRVLLVKAFLNYPKILLLDEPTASLDPDIAKKVREFLKKEREKFKVSMLFTSHNMSEVEEICDRIIFLDHGKIIARGTPAEIAKTITTSSLQLMVTKNREKALVFFESKRIPVKKEKNYLTFSIAEKEIAPFLISLAQQNIIYEEISIQKPNLEDFFLQIASKK